MDNTIEHRPISQLFDIVKGDLRKFDQEGLIDDGNLVKTVMYCNEKLGIPIRNIYELALNVDEFEAELPLNFEKLYYIAGLNCSNTRITHLRNPFDNNVDQDVIYKAHLDRGSLGCADNYKVTIERKGQDITYNQSSWTYLTVGTSSFQFCHNECPNKRKPGKYQVEIKDGKIHTPFKTGLVYIIYIGTLQDDEGNIMFPFHPLVTPYYEWTLKEKIISDAIFNSDSANLGDLYKIAQQEKSKAWLDAFNFTIDDQSFGNYKNNQHKREMGWYTKWFRYFQ